MSSTTSTATSPYQGFYVLLEEVKVSKADFNHLVMDYLISQGYPLAAQKFATEANMQPSPRIDSIRQRVEIREAIHSGDIKSAIERTNELNPQLLDENLTLHFALLRLQLVELIRKATSVPDGDITPALDFATTYLAPRAPTRPEFLSDLERTMALLIFPPDSLTPQLAELLRPDLRKTVASQVNEALLQSRGARAQATLNDLVSHRAWAHQRAVEECKEIVPEVIDLGLDPASERGVRGVHGNGTREKSENGTVELAES